MSSGEAASHVVDVLLPHVDQSVEADGRLSGRRVSVAETARERGHDDLPSLARLRRQVEARGEVGGRADDGRRADQVVVDAVVGDAAQRHLDVRVEAAVALADARQPRRERPRDGRRRAEVLEREARRLDGDEVREPGRREAGHVAYRQLLDRLAAQPQQRSAARQTVDVREPQQAGRRPGGVERPAADGRDRLADGRGRAAGVGAGDVEDGRRRAGADERDRRLGRQRAVGGDEQVSVASTVRRRRRHRDVGEVARLTDALSAYNT